MYSSILPARDGCMPVEMQERLVAALSTDSLEDSRPIAERYSNALPYFAELMEVDGEENIPLEGQLVVVKNHPGNFDTNALMYSLFKRRPDIVQVAKDSPLTRQLPPQNALLLRKQGLHAHPDDIAALQAHLQGGGSIITTPWGALDHEALANGATAEGAVRNAIRYARHGKNATVLPIAITLKLSVPFRIATIEIGQPIVPNPDGSLNVDEINLIVSGMFRRHVQEAAAETWPWEPGKRPRIRIDRSGPEPVIHFDVAPDEP